MPARHLEGMILSTAYKVLVNSISRGVRRWLMANPGSDPRFVENRIDVCPKKHLSVQCQTGAVRCLQLRFK